MSIQLTLLTAPADASSRFFRRFFASTAIIVATAGSAQPVIPHKVSTPSVPRIIQSSTAVGATAANAESPGTPISFGEFRLRPQVSASYLHTNGLPTGAGQRTDTDIFTFAPSIAAELGTHWTISYAPTWNQYSDEQLSDSVSHAFNLIGATQINTWTLQFSESYNASNDVIAETARQTKQHSWITSASASRPIGNRTNYDGSISLDERYADTAPDLKTWGTRQFARMQVSPKVNVGLGLDLNSTQSPDQADLTSTSFLGTLNWQPTQKINLSVEGGMENTQSDAPGTDNLRTPTLQAALAYQPFAQTNVALSLFRTVTPSFFADQLTKNKGWSVSLNQRLLEKLNLSLAYTRQTTDYVALGNPALPSPSRSDDITSFSSSLSFRLLQRLSVAATYQTSKNASSDNTFTFSTTQYGIDLSWAF